MGLKLCGASAAVLNCIDLPTSISALKVDNLDVLRQLLRDSIDSHKLATKTNKDIL